MSLKKLIAEWKHISENEHPQSDMTAGDQADAYSKGIEDAESSEKDAEYRNEYEKKKAARNLGNWNLSAAHLHNQAVHDAKNRGDAEREKHHASELRKHMAKIKEAIGE